MNIYITILYMSLYTDDNPLNTIKGTGFKHKQKVKETIKLISKRSPLYQFQVINTMYNRAKYHPHKTDNMLEAMELLETWLSKYKKEKRDEYEYLPLELVNKYEKLADEYNISRVSRGLDRATKSDEGFLVVYRKVKGNGSKMVNQLVNKSKPTGLDWNMMRHNFIKSRLGQMKHARTQWFNKDGLPTVQHTVLIMNGYSPYEDRLKKILKTHKFFN